MFCCKCTKNRRISKTRFIVYSSLLLKLTRLPPLMGAGGEMSSDRSCVNKMLPDCSSGSGIGGKHVGCPRTGGSPAVSAPPAGAACLIGGCGVPRRRVRRASSKGEVLEVSSAAKDVERETLRIRHTFCSPSSPGKEAKDEPPCPNGILPQNQDSRNLKYLIRVTDVYDIWFSIRKRLNIYAARKEFDFRRPGPSG